MDIQQQVSLKFLNTFGIDATSSYLAEVTSLEEVREVLSSSIYRDNQSMILGGGSNVLFTSDFDGLVIKNSLKGIELIRASEEHVWLKVQAGEVWHELVLYCIEQGYAGIENLSLIPGCCGAAPMQNIGAYGVELESVFESLEAVHLHTQEVHTFSKDDCQFGYRESVFKKEQKGQYIITSITLRLNKIPQYNVNYGAIQQTLEEMGVHDLSIKAISDAVIKIRSSKLPDPKEIGNAGSFFKNPVIPKAQFDELQKQHPQVPHYPAGEGMIKVPAAWLIDQDGWKGKVVGNTGSHKQQALVLVNYGNARGEEVKELAYKIKDSVSARFGIELTPEVNFI